MSVGSTKHIPNIFKNQEHILSIQNEFEAKEIDDTKPSTSLFHLHLETHNGGIFNKRKTSWLGDDFTSQTDNFLITSSSSQSVLAHAV